MSNPLLSESELSTYLNEIGKGPDYPTLLLMLNLDVAIFREAISAAFNRVIALSQIGQLSTINNRTVREFLDTVYNSSNSEAKLANDYKTIYVPRAINVKELLQNVTVPPHLGILILINDITPHLTTPKFDYTGLDVSKFKAVGDSILMYRRLMNSALVTGWMTEYKEYYNSIVEELPHLLPPINPARVDQLYNFSDCIIVNTIYNAYRYSTLLRLNTNSGFSLILKYLLTGFPEGVMSSNVRSGYKKILIAMARSEEEDPKTGRLGVETISANTPWVRLLATPRGAFKELSELERFDHYKLIAYEFPKAYNIDYIDAETNVKAYAAYLKYSSDLVRKIAAYINYQFETIPLPYEFLSEGG